MIVLAISVDEKNNISLIVSSLQSKVEKLVIQHKKAMEDIKQLKEENGFLRKNMIQEKNKIKELEEKYKVVKLAKSLNQENDKSTDIKLKINELVREIDKCIALLNN